LRRTEDDRTAVTTTRSTATAWCVAVPVPPCGLLVAMLADP